MKPRTISDTPSLSRGDTQRWLEALYGKSPGWFTVIIFKDGRPITKWFSTNEIQRVAPAIQKAAEQYDVYTSVATYKAKPEKGRGSLKDVQSVAGWWADLDIGEEGHKPAQRPNPKDVAEAMSMLDGMPEPTAVIHSGGGLQVWWMFDEPWVFEDPKPAQQASNEFQARLQKQAESVGLHIDSVGDLPRILRVPGTMNHKTDNVRPVELVRLDDRRYPAAELTSIGEIREEVTPPRQFSTWESILEPHGWTKAGKRLEDGATLWVRPGKTAAEGHSAVTDPYGVPVMVNFSGSAGLPVGPGQRLTRFRVWAFLNYGGDLARAKDALESMSLVDPAALQERAQRFQPLDWPSVFSGAQEPVKWLCEPLLEAGRQIACYSEAKAGKSLLWLEIAARLAAGLSQWDDKPHAVEPVDVVYIDMENTTVDIGERLIKMGFTPEDFGDRFHYYSFPSIGYLDTREGALNVLALGVIHNASAIIIDTLSRVVEGDENENDTYHHFYKHTGVALKAQGIALVRLDHSGKDVQKGMRGASSKTTDVDEVWQLEVEEDRLLLRRTHTRSAHGDDRLDLRRVDVPALHHTKDLVTIEELMGTPSEREDNEINEMLKSLRALGISRRASVGKADEAWEIEHGVTSMLVRKVQNMRRNNEISKEDEEARCAEHAAPVGSHQDS